jgi:hypothetical protein
MADDGPSPGTPAEPGRGVSRRDLEQVIRRAAELHSTEAESEEHLSEADVVRIAQDLGLPARHVRQALYELPAQRGPQTRLDRWYGPPFVQETRVISGAPTPTLDRIEEYLVTREFLRLLRRQGDRALFTPADDTISNIVRAVRRPAGQWQIARSPRVLVEVRAMPTDESHVRVELDVEQARSRMFRNALAGGAAAGIPLAVLAGAPAGAVVLDLAGAGPAAAAAIVSAAAALSASAGAGVALGRARFRARLDHARTEVAALLDRLETGGRLDPPPAPWLRGIRSRISRTLRGHPDPSA